MKDLFLRYLDNHRNRFLIFMKSCKAVADILVVRQRAHGQSQRKLWKRCTRMVRYLYADRSRFKLGAEDEWFVGVFGDIITFITGAAAKNWLHWIEFGKANDLYVRQNKMVYAEEPTKQLPLCENGFLHG